MKKQLILASASVRRKRLLREAGVLFDVISPDVKEVSLHGNVRRSVIKNALLKNKWIADRFPGRPILSADTSIEFKRQCVGKPRSRKEAVKMMRSFSGKTHKVFTAVAFHKPGTRKTQTAVSVSTVTFKTLTSALISRYFRKVNPMDKAGAYDIGQHGKMIVEKYSGSFTNIVGLPMELTELFLREAHIRFSNNSLIWRAGLRRAVPMESDNKGRQKK